MKAKLACLLAVLCTHAATAVAQETAPAPRMRSQLAPQSTPARTTPVPAAAATRQRSKLTAVPGAQPAHPALRLPARQLWLAAAPSDDEVARVVAALEERNAKVRTAATADAQRESQEQKRLSEDLRADKERREQDNKAFTELAARQQSLLDSAVRKANFGRTAGIVAFGLAAGFGATALYGALDGKSTDAALRGRTEAYQTGGELQAQFARGERDNTMAWVGLIGAGVTAVLGTVSWVVLGPVEPTWLKPFHAEAP